MTRVPSIAELRAVCQPPAIMGRRSEEHWTGRLYMRRVSLHVTRAAIRFGMSANGVTWLMMGVGVAGAAVLAVGGVWPAVVTALAMQLFVLLDASDGEVARWNRTQGATGIYLDRIAHYTNEVTLYAALGWRSASGDLTEPWMLIGLVAGLGVLFSRIETDLVDAARAKAGLPAVRDEGGDIRPRSVRTLRRIADFLPIHRATGAVEMSLLAVVAAVVDAGRSDLLATRSLLVVAHLVSILSSDRLR